MDNSLKRDRMVKLGLSDLRPADRCQLMSLLRGFGQVCSFWLRV